jgi:hypothetical protein
MTHVLRGLMRLVGMSRGSPSPAVGKFSVVQGARGSLATIVHREATMRCAGECTCRCCK